MSAALELWQTEWCPASHRVRQRLTELGLSFVAHQVPVEPDARRAPAGRVHGAINIPLGQLGSRLGEIDRDRRVAFLCHSGSRSTRATGIALKAGYDAVNVRGGMTAWNRAGLPLSRKRRKEVRFR